MIDVRDFSVGLALSSGESLPVLRQINLSVKAGETVGLVGESGSGKSTLALAMMGYLKRGLRVLEGRSFFKGQDIFALSRQELEKIRGGKLGLVPQNSGQSLTPNLRVGAQLCESLKLHGKNFSSQGLSKRDLEKRAEDLLAQVRLPEPAAMLARFPHELSGGQQQRVAIAMALAGEPDALLLDEPTTGLDVTTQAHVLDLLHDLAAERGMAMVYVSHDLGAIARVCDRIVVLYAGEIVLEGTARQVLCAPAHPYARALLAAIPKLSAASLPHALDGRPPALGEEATGCRFAPRCAIASELCREQMPDLSSVVTGGKVRCHHADQVADIPLIGSERGGEERRCGDDVVLALDDVALSYARPGFLETLRRVKKERVATVDRINVTLRRGETLALVGESGSGKSTILKAIAGILPPLRGEIKTGDERPLSLATADRDADQLRQIQLIFQNPDESLNPRHTVAQILAQPLTLYFGLSGDDLTQRSIELLRQVRLGSHYLDRLPTQLSGGEKQRVAIARAFAAQPDLVLCDEITSALDVSVQAAVLSLLDDLRCQNGTSYIFVCHDLAVVRAFADRVAVLYQGRLCEVGPTTSVYGDESHPYTEVLRGAVLEPDPDFVPDLKAMDVVESAPPARGCPFQRRCPKHLGTICDTVTPPRLERSDGHAIWCHRFDSQ